MFPLFPHAFDALHDWPRPFLLCAFHLASERIAQVGVFSLGEIARRVSMHVFHYTWAWRLFLRISPIRKSNFVLKYTLKGESCELLCKALN